MASPQIQFRAVPPMDTALQERTHRQDTSGMSEIARRDLARYHQLMRAELAAVASRLTPSGALLICDVMSGTLMDELLVAAHHLDHVIEDAIRLDGLDAKWDIDGDRLLELIRGWSVGQRLAVCDAVERFWIIAGEHEEYEPALRAVGLLPQLGMLARRRPAQ